MTVISGLAARIRGPGMRPGVDLVADHDVEPGLGRGGAVDAGEAVVEQQPRVVHRRQRVLLGRQFAELGRARNTSEADVAMALGHARHQRHALAVDRPLGLLARDLVPALGDLGDPIGADQDLARERRPPGRIEDQDVGQQLAGHQFAPRSMSRWREIAEARRRPPRRWLQSTPANGGNGSAERRSPPTVGSLLAVETRVRRGSHCS